MRLNRLVTAFSLSVVLMTDASFVSRNAVSSVEYLPAQTAAKPAAAAQADWPQWQGPNRNAISAETGLLQQWPPAGPPVIWLITNLGNGYGTVAIRGGRIYVQGTQGRESVVFCLNEADGKTLWMRSLGPSLDDDKGGGPRGTPTVEADRLYALSETGNLACLSNRDGTVLWSRNILKDFGGSNPRWKLSESPLVDGNNLIVTPGGRRAGIVALDKTNGKTIWASQELSDAAAYASCVLVNVQGVRAITTLTASAAVGVRADDGKLLWRYERVANDTANIATPLVDGDRVFYTTNYGVGCALLGLTAQSGLIQARELYFSREMMNHHGGVILVDGFLYGFSNAILTCMEFETGSVRWRDRSVGKGSLTYADGNLYLLSENNVVGLAQATPDGYREKGRFQIADQGWPSWAHPVICNGRLYLRNQGVLSCYKVK